MRYKAVLFDMDGTVMNTLEDMCDSVNQSLSEFSLPAITLDQTRQFVGNGARRLIEQAVPENTPQELTEQVLAFYLPWYASHCMVKTKPYDGILELMKKLRTAGFRQCIVSNKPDEATAGISAVWFADLADFSLGQRDDIRRKPYPDMVLAAMDRMHLSAEECVYIGDSEVDVETAKNAGIPCISVLWGFRDKQMLSQAGAVQFAETPEELYRLLTE